MNIVKLIVSSVIMSTLSLSLSAQDSVIVEWAPYSKWSIVTDTELINAANILNLAFLSLQKGFIKRELVKKSETEYADIIYWATQKDADLAGSKVNSCSVCAEYFKLMNRAKSNTAGAGFSYYRILKTW